MFLSLTRRLFCTCFTPETDFHDVLRAALFLAALDLACQRHLAAGDLDLNVGGIEPAIIRQAVVHILADPLIRAGVALGAPASVLILLAAPTGVIIAEPGRDFVGRLVPHAASALLLP